MIEICVTGKNIAVLKQFVAENGIRLYLNGIHFEIGSTEARLVASNGHIVACHRLRVDLPSLAEPLADIVVPIGMFAQVKPNNTPVCIAIGEADPTDGAREVRVTQDGTSMVGRTVIGRWAGWRNAFPDTVSNETAQFDTALVGKIDKAYAILHRRKGACAAIGHNGEGGALFTLDDDDFFGVIMPRRDAQAPTKTPPWVFASLGKSRAPEPVEGLV